MSNDKAKKVDIRKKVTVYATAEHPFIAEGKAFQTGEVLAPHLLKKGYITMEDPNPKKAGKAKEEGGAKGADNTGNKK